MGQESGSKHLALVLASRIQRRLFRRIGPVRMNGDSADKSLIVRKALAENHHALGCDFVLANILGMVPAAHLDHDHDFAKLAIDGDVAQPDDVVGEERNRVGTERKFLERLINLKSS